jgi:hypothetical protein
MWVRTPAAQRGQTIWKITERRQGVRHAGDYECANNRVSSNAFLRLKPDSSSFTYGVMKQPGFQASEPKPLEAPRIRSARGYHRLGRLLQVVLLLTLAFFGSLAFLIGAAGLMLTEKPLWGWLALGGLGTFTVCRVSVFVLSKTLTCPLCHGTVMHEKRCRKHANAFRIWPLSYRASAVISILFTASFRCMYCGTPWRLQRTSRH